MCVVTGEWCVWYVWWRCYVVFYPGEVSPVVTPADIKPFSAHKYKENKVRNTKVLEMKLCTWNALHNDIG